MRIHNFSFKGHRAMNKTIIFLFFIFFSGCSIQLLGANSVVTFLTLGALPHSSTTQNLCTDALIDNTQIRIEKITVQEPYNTYRIHLEESPLRITTLPDVQWVSALSHLYTNRVQSLIQNCTPSRHLPIYTNETSGRSEYKLDLNLITAHINKQNQEYYVVAQTICNLRKEKTGELIKTKKIDITEKIDSQISTLQKIESLVSAIDKSSIGCLEEFR